MEILEISMIVAYVVLVSARPRSVNCNLVRSMLAKLCPIGKRAPIRQISCLAAEYESSAEICRRFSEVTGFKDAPPDNRNMVDAQIKQQR